MTVRYGDRCAYWVDDRSLAEHFAACLTARSRVTAVVHIGRALAPPAEDRSPGALAALTYEALCAPIEAFGELVVAPSDTRSAPDEPRPVHID